jgi:hypothetical protein
MKSDPNLMKRYFLGGASPKERAGLESQYFADAEIFEELVAVENDLIDSYVRGRLSNLERQQFEQQYLNSSQRWARVEFARTLTKVAHEAERSVPAKVSFWRRVAAPFRQAHPSLQWAFVASAIVLLVASGSWLVRQNQELRAELQRARAPQSGLRQAPPVEDEQLAAKAQKDQSAAGPEVARLEPSVLPELSLSLNPGISRSNQTGQEVLALSSSASWVRLKLSLDDDDHAAYEAVLETAEGREIQRVADLRSHVIGGRRIVTLRLPTRLVQPGDYIVKLNASNGSPAGAEEVEVYSFRTVRK